MEEYAVQVLRMGEDAPIAQCGLAGASISTHKNLNAALSARTVIAKLTQGPQSIAPTMIVIARRGKKDLPITSPVCNRN
jgi:hypothetical protein